MFSPLCQPSLLNWHICYTGPDSNEITIIYPEPKYGIRPGDFWTMSNPLIFPIL
jgi:hypothetical protein